MKLQPVTFAQGLRVEGYGPDFFRVNLSVHHGPMFTCQDEIVPWGGWSDTQLLLDHAADFDILFIGVGADMMYLPQEFRSALEAEGLALEPMVTPSACRTYNVLLSEGRHVALAALPV